MMKRLSILLDDLAFMRSMFAEGFVDPVRYGILAENAGVNGLVCTFTGSAKGISEKDLRLLKDINRSFLNVRIPLQNEAMRLVLSLAPDMVTFVEAKPTDPRKVSPLELGSFPGEIEEMIPNLQSNSIAVSVLVKPEMDFLKAISKLPIDYVEIDTSEFTAALDINDEIVALDKIKSAALAVGKWGIGVNCSGDVSFQDLASLAQVPNLEDIILGTQFIQRSVYAGIEKAVQEALEIIRFQEFE